MLVLIHDNYLVLNSGMLQRYWIPLILYYAIMDYFDEILNIHVLHNDMIEDFFSAQDE